MARSSECTEQYAQKVLDRDPHCQRRDVSTAIQHRTTLAPDASCFTLTRTGIAGTMAAVLGGARRKSRFRPRIGLPGTSGTSIPVRNRKGDNVMKLSLSKTACIVFAFCAATAIMSPAQTKFTWVYSFDGQGAHGGANPGFGNLVQGPDGYLYGTTEVSVGTEGTVFKISTAGKLKTLYVFCTGGEPCLYGAKPLGGLSLGSNGKFYGTASLGGSPGDGTVFQITSAGKLTWLYDFGSTTNGSQPWAPPILAANKLLYGTTSIGGSANEGTIYEMTTTGTNAASLRFPGKKRVHPDRKSLV